MNTNGTTAGNGLNWINPSWFQDEPVRIEALTGYDNHNYLLEFNQGKAILKTYVNTEIIPLLRAENELLLHLHDANPHAYPVPLPFSNGQFLLTVEEAGKPGVIRLLSYLDGEFLGELQPNPKVARSLGSFLAKLTHALRSWSHPEIRSRQWEWNMLTPIPPEERLKHIVNPGDRSLVHYFLNRFDAEVRPYVHKMRHSTLHNDANEWNVLTATGKVSGIIDFGDVAYGPIVFDLAIAMVYASYDKSEPLKWACYVLRGYHKHYPLEEAEISVLYYVMAMRLCLSVCNAATAGARDPANAYISISEEKARAMLRYWLQLNPISVENTFRNLLGLPSLKAVSVASVKKARHAVLSPVYSLSYRKPILMKGAAFQYMYDAAGNTYLDAYNNIPHVGHAHPKVVEAAQKQMGLLNTNTRYLYEQLPRYAEKLLEKFPAGLNKVFLVNSGSEATDLAIRLAQTYTANKKLIVLEHGYHGSTRAAIEVSDYKFNQKGGIGQQENIINLPLPWNGRGDVGTTGKDYADEAVELLERSGEEIAGFIHETILGCAGQVPLPIGYLKPVYAKVREMGGVCIADEVQTGFGRIGSHFWAFQAHEVIPDIVILGKPMGNGHPMGAVITTEAIANAFDTGVEFFSSFGGNPVSCAIGEAVLDVIASEGLQEQALEVGTYYKQQLEALREGYPSIISVRGSGLFLGIELVDTEGKPGTTLAGEIKNTLREKFILISTDGPYNNVLKTKPPLCFTKANCDEVVQTLADFLKLHQ